MSNQSSVTAHMNLTGLTVAIDTNQIASAGADSAMLVRLGAWGWIYVQKTDVLDVELTKAPLDKVLELKSASAVHAEIMGPYVTFQPTQEDLDRFHAVFKTISPGADLADTKINHIRDAMHVATAIRSRVSAFVTSDKKILKAADSLALAFDGFHVQSPAQALICGCGLSRAG